MSLVESWVVSLFTKQLGDSNSGVLHLKKKKKKNTDLGISPTQHSNFFKSHFRVQSTAENEVKPT